MIMMKNWEVKFNSYNRQDYYKTVSGKNKKEARKYANRLTIKKDDRDKIEFIREDTSVDDRLL